MSSCNWLRTYSFIAFSFLPTVSTYVDTVGKNKKAIEEYIRNQLIEDEMMDQMTIKEYVDPFTGSKNRKA